MLKYPLEYEPAGAVGHISVDISTNNDGKMLQHLIYVARDP